MRRKHFRPLPFNIPNSFPYTNFHQLNLDWILELMRTFEDTYNNLEDIIREIVQEEIEETLYNKIIDMLGFINVCNPPAPLEGLDNTGAQDCTAKFNAIMEYASTKGHCIMYFPAGVYAVRPLTINKGIVLIGECKYDTTLSLMGNSDKALIYGELTEVTIANLTLSANIQGQSKSIDCINAKFKDTEVLNVNLNAGNIGLVAQENGGHAWISKIGVCNCTYGALQFAKGALPDDYCPVDPNDVTLPTTDIVVDTVYVDEFVGHVAEFVVDNHVNKIDIKHLYNVAKLPEWILINDGHCVDIEIRTDGVDNYEHNDATEGHVKINCDHVWDYFKNVYNRSELLNVDGVVTNVSTQTLSVDSDVHNESVREQKNELYGAKMETVNNDSTLRIGGTYDTNVGGDHFASVTGMQDLHVGGNRNSLVEGNDTDNVKGDLYHGIGGDRETLVSGNDTCNVTGDETLNVTGDYIREVGKTETLHVAGGKEMTVGAGYDVHVAGAAHEMFDSDYTKDIAGGEYHNTTGNRTTVISGDDSRQCQNDTSVIGAKQTETVHGDKITHVGAAVDMDVSGSMSLDVGGNLDVTGDNAINVKSDDLVLDPTNPLTYRTPTYTAGYFGSVPAKDKAGTEYKILTDYNSSKKIDDHIDTVVNNAIAGIPPAPAPDPLWEQNYNLKLFTDNYPYTWWYIDGVSGNDDNPGTADQPFKTIKKAFGLANNTFNGRSIIRTYILTPGTYVIPSQLCNSTIIIINKSNGSVTLDTDQGGYLNATNCNISLRNNIQMPHAHVTDADGNLQAVSFVGCYIYFTDCTLNSWIQMSNCYAQCHNCVSTNGLLVINSFMLITADDVSKSVYYAGDYQRHTIYARNCHMTIENTTFSGATLSFTFATRETHLTMDGSFNFVDVSQSEPLGQGIIGIDKGTLCVPQSVFNTLKTKGNISFFATVTNVVNTTDLADDYQVIVSDKPLLPDYPYVEY